ncbi:hypothetical protein RMN56_11105 [Micromonospora halotolerans]|uniref:Uncharacterized protein n=1 Tax=Micromonospora halotolerans TaxID=709879 RepID=A0ABZ0A3P5_9ACTN|nr:hypothetical protein [Micromonospora halotolerans]WNM41845.1 hypothetical protein RMN56_11105 [Micromonospora halotolerans]
MIEELTRRYLHAVDQALPGYVCGLYVVGSAACDSVIAVADDAWRRFGG